MAEEGLIQEPVASSSVVLEEEAEMEVAHSRACEPEASTSLGEMDRVHLSSRQKTKLKNGKICGVCGDKSLGYNFNAITCESCKAFFRRNAFKDKSIKCLFENNCSVDIRTRRFCPACRIKKCFKIGMNRDMILDDRERKKRQSKKVSPVLKVQPMTSDAEESSVHVIIKTEPESVDLKEAPNQLTDTKKFVPPAKMIGEKGNIRFNHPPAEALPTEKNMYPELIERESQFLKSITDAYRCTMASIPSHKKEQRYDNTADLINHSELVVRKLIMFVKYLEDFRAMIQEDQIACLKACVMHSVLLRSALFYDVEKDAWLTDKDEYIPTSILKSATGFVSVHNYHVHYCRKVKTMAKNDLNMYALMQMVLIFDPAGSNLSNRPYVSSIQDRYFIILKHYLESRFSYKFAKEYLNAFVDCMCDVKNLGEHHSKILLQVNPLGVEPLMLEVLNLK